ncbi:hypothetical protein B0J11DRAFT_547463 [Dendryphion nanum]|uniref:TFIIE beta domain-containing protein n=1 Tax=Dendryphion nanum TaxID=256645 RepID=A0A9P9EDR7_9PLEO|nr:hypothetical protein B0J11DRAFT_547463 [Dendryphion nanum]
MVRGLRKMTTLAHHQLADDRVKKRIKEKVKECCGPSTATIPLHTLPDRNFSTRPSSSPQTTTVISSAKMSYLKTNSSSKLSAPSPTPSATSANGAKRKRETGPQTVYSQPQETGTGIHLMTQVTYTIEYLREEKRWMTLQEITDYLNLHQTTPNYEHAVRTLQSTFRKKDPQNRIEWDPRTNKYRYKPKYDIRNADDLKSFLQKQKSAQGLPVRELKDGWTEVQEGINKMEEKKEILVKRNQKDLQAKTVWINDPSLMYPMEKEFKDAWLQISLPANPDDLRNGLIKAGLKPSSAPREAKTVKTKENRKKAARRGGKQTNTHMANLLRDFSHLRK